MLGVHVVPGGDDDGVDVLAVQELAVVGVLGDGRAGDFGGALAALIPGVADGDPLDAAHLVGDAH